MDLVGDGLVGQADEIGVDSVEFEVVAQCSGVLLLNVGNGIAAAAADTNNFY